MASIKRSAIVPYSAAQMYELVNHVEAYPEFLTWCKSCQVLARNEDEVRATLRISKAGIDKSFTTCNRLQVNKMIEIRLLDGPFKHLHGFWRFQEIDDNSSRVSLDLEFELVGGFMDNFFEPIFMQIANSFVQLFCKRAITVYGYREFE